MSTIQQSSSNVRRNIVVVLAGLVSCLAFAAPSQAQAAEHELQPIRLIVHDTEDGWPDNRDEPRMYYGGQTWAGLVGNPWTVDGAELPTARFTGSTMRIDLWERDNGWTDHNLLGSVNVYGEVTPGGEERYAHFGGWAGSNWHYELVYRVAQVS